MPGLTAPCICVAVRKDAPGGGLDASPIGDSGLTKVEFSGLLIQLHELLRDMIPLCFPHPPKVLAATANPSMERAYRTRFCQVFCDALQRIAPRGNLSARRGVGWVLYLVNGFCWSSNSCSRSAALCASLFASRSALSFSLGTPLIRSSKLVGCGRSGIFVFDSFAIGIHTPGIFDAPLTCGGCTGGEACV